MYEDAALTWAVDRNGGPGNKAWIDFGGYVATTRERESGCACSETGSPGVDVFLLTSSDKSQNAFRTYATLANLIVLVVDFRNKGQGGHEQVDGG